MFREFFKQRIQRGLVRRLNNLKIAAMARRVAQRESQPDGAPVVFFKASTGIDDLFMEQRLPFAGFVGVPFAGYSCCLFRVSFGDEPLCAGHEP